MPKTLEMNGLVERMNQTVMERVQSMLAYAKLFKKFWSEALMTMAYVITDHPQRPWMEVYHKECGPAMKCRTDICGCLIVLPTCEMGLCIIEVTLDMINKEDDDKRLLRMQNQTIDENDEVHEDIIDELEDMDDEDDSA